MSRYLGSAADERHVRFSIWNESGTAEAAVSGDDAEAERLGRFLLGTGKPAAPGTTRAVTPIERLRAAVRA